MTVNHVSHGLTFKFFAADAAFAVALATRSVTDLKSISINILDNCFCDSIVVMKGLRNQEEVDRGREKERRRPTSRHRYGKWAVDALRGVLAKSAKQLAMGWEATTLTVF